MQVLHGGENDIIWLQRDFQIYIANLFDTEKAAAVCPSRFLQFLACKSVFCISVEYMLLYTFLVENVGLSDSHLAGCLFSARRENLYVYIRKV